MFLKLRLDANHRKIFILDLVSFVEEENRRYFLLRSTENDLISINVPFPLEASQAFASSVFKSSPFISITDSKENNIYEVYVDNKSVKRIGWIFPIQSLVSIQHSFAENKFFLKYAFVAFKNLLIGEVLVNHEFTFDGYSGTINLDEIYPSILNILTLSDIKTLMIRDFSILNYLPSLYSHNYIICNQISDVFSTSTSVKENHFTVVKVAAISSCLRQEIYIESLYKDHLLLHIHPLVKFHFLYQVIELLLSRIYDSEIQIIINKSGAKSKALHDLKIELIVLTGEDVRIKKLFNKPYSRSFWQNSSQMLSITNSLLTIFGKEKTTLEDALYQVRNIVVHDFRSISLVDKGLTLFKDITSMFDKLIIHLLIDYEEPDYHEFASQPLSWLQYKLTTEN